MNDQVSNSTTVKDKPSVRDVSHYSYALYEKDEVTHGFDKARFSGDVGRFFRSHQENLIHTHLPDPGGCKILDLGAGTGRTTIPLCHKGADVVAADASMKMLGIIREKAFLQGTGVSLSRIDAHHLPFADLSFDVAMSFRMIMHVTDWKQAMAELCRVARHSVIVDFPPRIGFAGLAPLVHPLIRPFNPNHQSYRVFMLKEVVNELAKHDFTVTTIDKHVVLPFGLHRAMNSLKITQLIEGALAKIGLRDLFGAPVTLIAERLKTN